MANSAGGLIFYGVAEHPKDSGKNHQPSGIDPVTDPKITKEWLEQVINAGTRPRILDIEIVPIRVTQPQPGVVFMVNIPAGTTAHQADDKRYYRRFNFANEPMHDHEIRDVMGRNKHPVVRLSARINIGPASIMGYSRSNEQYRWLKLGLHNEGTKMAHKVMAFVHIPQELLVEPEKMIGVSLLEIEGVKLARLTLSNKIVEEPGPLPMFKEIEGPLLPGLSISLRTVRLIGTSQPLPPRAAIIVKIFADEAPPRSDVIRLADIDQPAGKADEED